MWSRLIFIILIWIKFSYCEEDDSSIIAFVDMKRIVLTSSEDEGERIRKYVIARSLVERYALSNTFIQQIYGILDSNIITK